MGIIKTARDDFAADLAAWKAANPTATRAQKRKYVAALSNAAMEWLNKFDSQDNAALADFAASKGAQFTTFVAALAEPTLDPVDPTS